MYRYAPAIIDELQTWRYVLYVALHEVYNFYIQASIEVYIKYLESDPDPILS